MARILINSIWYNELSVSSLYESEFEALFKLQAHLLFPGFSIAEFKHLVESPYGKGKPDLALIDKDYRSWWVIEVEKSSHDFETHVMKQVQIFSSADYNGRAAMALHLSNPELMLEKLESMMKGIPPKVIVVVEKPMDHWMPSLQRWDALLCVFQVFRSVDNKHIYRINGQSPLLPAEVYSECEFEKFLPNFLIVKSPTVLEVANHEFISLVYKDEISKWKRLDVKNKVYLIPKSTNPLRADGKYKLYRGNDGNYYISHK